MHSSYALSSDDFAVERDGAAGPLSDLWPGGYQPGDRLGVVLNQPMDPCGCSNLICATNTLFYDVLRDTKGTGGFFRYADTYLIGVGCEPGDFNQLDVWPMHKFVGVLQPTAEAVLETINDRRITLLVLPEVGLRCRGEVVLSTWNALLAQVRCVVTYSPRTGRARDADVGLLGNKIVESYVEQAIFSTPGIGAGEQARLRRLRRAIDREPLRSFEQYKTLPNAAAARALLGVTEVLPPGHQEVSRRSAPTIILPLEVAMGAPLDTTSAPLDAATALSAPPPAKSDDEDTGSYELPTGTLRHTPFDAIQRRMGGQFAEWEGWDWISDFGDPLAEHHAVRETVGVWDESPLQKWLFRGPDALAAADYCFTSDMAGLAVGQVRYGAFCDERGKMLGDGTVYNTGDNERGILVVTALSTDGDHFRKVTAEKGLNVEIAEVTAELPHLQLQGPKSRELLASLTDADIASLRYFRFLEDVTIGGVPGCLVSRTGYSGELGFEIYTSPENAERLWSALLDPGQALGIRPYGLAAVESLRVESGLIFIGFDYFPAHTSPFHMNLERMIKLDKPDFHGKDALVAEHGEGITHGMVTLVIAGEEAPEYNSPVYRHGREVGRLLSPSAGRSPSVDRLIGLACIELELTEVGTPLEVALTDGRMVPALVDRYPIYDPEKTRPRA
jgi:glycine cleavage system T protein (aminomethyltransferase)